MFRDIGDLGLGILPGEGLKKIWASCLYILFYLFTSRSEQTWFLTDCFRKEWSKVSKEAARLRYIPSEVIEVYYIERQLYFPLEPSLTMVLFYDLFIYSYLLTFIHIYSYLLVHTFSLNAYSFPTVPETYEQWNWSSKLGVPISTMR